MCDKAYNEWTRKKKEEDRMRRMSGIDQEEEFERDDQVDYNANFKEFVDSIVNENYKNIQEQNDIYSTPMQ